MEGTVEVDGAYFCGHIRPANVKADRVDRRLKRHQTGRRRVVVAFRERRGRVLPFVTKSEPEGVPLAQENVSRNAIMAADEASPWDDLHNGWRVLRVNHSFEYSGNDGRHTNMVESQFSRLRRMVVGQHHHVSPQYLYQYANQCAWLEDNRPTATWPMVWSRTPCRAASAESGKATGSGRHKKAKAAPVGPPSDLVCGRFML